MRRLDVILAQLNPRLRDVEGNIRAARDVLERHAGADLVVFPELFLSGYTTHGLDGVALSLEGPEVGAMARAARENGANVIFGMPERVEGGVANSAVCVDRRGDLLCSYRKTHLFGEERGAFVAGDGLRIAEVDGVKVGLMICFDVEFPEVARSLALAGAELLVTVSANMEPFGRDHDVFATARALENGVAHLYVNQVGEGESFTFAGGTMAVSADGDRLAQAGAAEGVIRASIDPSATNAERPDELRPRYLEEMRGPLPVAIPDPSEGTHPRPPRPGP